MAENTRRRRADSLPWSLRHSKFGVDELDLKRSNSLSARLDEKLDLEHPLSPIEEEREPETSSAPLQVNLIIRFFDPVVRSVYHRTYSSSQSFVPTDQVCRGMLRRIEHCSEELITRKDSGALTPIQCLRKGPKDLRFEMTFQIYRKGYPGVWAERVFESYQKQPLTSASAMDLLRCTHNIIGIFLRRHDDHFRWIDEPSHEYFPEKPATFKPSLTGPPDLACVPRSRFIECTQKWEVVPGYALELTFESRNPTRRHPDIRRVLKVGSTQTAPLTLGLGEDLLWQAHRAVEYMLDSRKNAFDIKHAGCKEPDGVSDCACHHLDEDALKIELRSVNNLGPTYEHLCRSIRSRLRLFEHPTGRDCDEFVATVRARFHQLRDGTDKKLEMLNDFDFHIADLIGHGWHIKNPAHFVIDGTQRRTRRSIEALLDRIRTGVGDVLRGHDVAIRMIAYSRGHLILDKALIARNHQSSPHHVPSVDPEDEQRLYVARLTARIQKDIDMICKDTCSLEDIPVLVSESERPVRLRTVPSRSFAPRSMASQSSLYTLPGAPGLFTQPPIPPCIPFRSSSKRVFPLVPARYHDNDDEERPASASPSEQDSAIGIDHDSDGHECGEALNMGSSYEKRVPAVVLESQREDGPHSDKPCGLKPAAEVKRARDEADDTNSSILTYSSVPALTESRTPSPGHSLLITPKCVQDSPPRPSSLHFFHNSDSTPLRMLTPDPKSKHDSVPGSLTGPKSVVPSSDLPLRRPVTPLDQVAQGPACPASPSTPKSLRGPRFAEAGAVTRTVQEAQQAPRDNTELQVAMSGDMKIDSELHPITVPDSKAAGPDVTGTITSETTQQDLPVEGWLLYSDEAADEEEAIPLADLGETEGLIGVDQCGSSEALKPHTEETIAKQESDPAVSEPRSHGETDQINAVASPAPAEADEQPLPQLDRVEDVTESSGPTETQVIGLVDPNGVSACDEDECKNDVGDLSTSSEMSTSKVDCSEEGGDSDNPESFQPQGPPEVSVSTEPGLRLDSVSEVFESGHVESLSDSVVTDVGQDAETTEASISEIEGQTEPGRIEDSASEAPSDLSGVPTSGLEISTAETKATSELLDVTDVREGTSKALICVTDEVFTSVPILTREQAASSEVKSPLAWNRDLTQSVSSPRPTTLTHVGLGNGYLQRLSPFSRFGTGINQSSNSLSSSSEWEDYASEAHQSSDSVDTVGLAAPAPLPGRQEDDGLPPPRVPDPPRPTGKPTAGLLGLHGSRWAGLGIRGALTGTHAFDRAPPVTVAVTSLPDDDDDDDKNSPRREARQESPVPRTENAVGAGVRTQRNKRPSASQHQRLLRLRHNNNNNNNNNKSKSSSSSPVTSPGAHARSPKLNRREGAKGEENSRPAVAAGGRPGDDSEGRFPRAMLVVAGLAMFSSMVNKNAA